MESPARSLHDLIDEGARESSRERSDLWRIVAWALLLLVRRVARGTSRPMRWLPPAFGLVSLVLSAAACSTSDEVDYSGSCRELAARCHSSRSALGRECHDLGHRGDDALCGPRREECLRECPEVEEPDDSNDAAAARDATSDAGTMPCEIYCECAGQVCKSQPAYPFADEAACLSACEAFASDDLRCFNDACEGARFSADPSHGCQHATGAVACH